MLFIDSVYGVSEINEAVLLDLMGMPIVQRLKYLRVHGMPDRYYYGRHPSRYDHSVGVVVLLKKTGASLAQQVAGLLHEVSVPAFFHIIEWSIKQGLLEREDLGEIKIHRNYLIKQKIPDFLDKYQIDFDEVLEYGQKPLLRVAEPDISVDLIDLLLREFTGWLMPDLASGVYQNLYCHQGELLLTNVESGGKLLENYIRLQHELWGTTEAMIRYFLFSQMLKLATESGVIGWDDLYRPERDLLEIIFRSGIAELVEILNRLSEDSISKKWEPVGHTLVNNLEYIDPKIYRRGEIHRLSQLDRMSCQLNYKFIDYCIRGINI